MTFSETCDVTFSVTFPVTFPVKFSVPFSVTLSLLFSVSGQIVAAARSPRISSHHLEEIATLLGNLFTVCSLISSNS